MNIATSSAHNKFLHFDHARLGRPVHIGEVAHRVVLAKAEASLKYWLTIAGKRHGPERSHALVQAQYFADALKTLRANRVAA